MGMELVRTCLNEEDLDFPALPPGFESFTSFKSKKVENSENESCCSFSSNISEQKSVDEKTELGHGRGGKISRSLRRRPSINYGQIDQYSDEECDSEQNFSMQHGLPKGVIRGCAQCQNCQKVTARWRPEGACRPDLEDVPVFYPSEEEFKDTIKYIEKIRPKAEPYGICRIIPPPSWKPPCRLKDKDRWERSEFATRVQKVDKLQNRYASRKHSKVHSHTRKKRRRCSRMGFECGVGSEKNLEQGEFGFESGPDFTLDSFQRYADDFKAQYFKTDNCADSGFKRAKSTEKWEPSVETIEGEYWRVVEKPTEEIEVLYGADLETGVFGSGFPKQSDQSCSFSDEEYVKSGWNLNNLSRLPGSVLSYENGDISGVQVPWLYVGMCFSSFCWHVEDHHLYSLNYMHFGDSKMWYGVPGNYAIKLEDAMKKHLPDLFDEQPDLLHKLVTQLSPSILKSEGVPVYRCVQNAGEVVLTFPRAYHSGFNCGFNCAEAVNVAPIDWFPHGQNAVELYSVQGRKTTISHDKLLLGAARDAVKANWELNLLRKKTADNLRWKDVCGRDGILAKSLRARIETETFRREFLCKNSKVVKMESNFDASTDKECSICFFDLHLSAVGCHCSPDKFTCLKHAKQLCTCDLDGKFYLFRYDIAELNLLVDALEGKLSAVYRWARLDLGLALSSCISKDNVQGVGLTGPFSENPGEICARQTNSQSLVTSKSPEAVLALGETKIRPFKLSREVKRKKDKSQVGRDVLEFPVCNQRSSALKPQMKSSVGQDDVICLSDDEEEQSNKPNVHEMVEGCEHKLNLCDLANAALAAESNLNLNLDNPKDDCLSCSTPPKDDDEHNLSCHQGSMDSSVENIASNPSLGLSIKVSHENPVQRVYQGSQSCSQSNVDKYRHQKGPRIAKVIRRINCNVEPIEFGVVIPGNLWSNSRAIFPKGFKSRVRYINILDPTNMCNYISEILDGGSKGPLFMVNLEHCPSEVFVHISPTRCWEMVRERVNQEITKLYKLGINKLPPLQPPSSLDGLEMFGFTSTPIIQVMESMDKNHVCAEYWSSRPLSQISDWFQSSTGNNGNPNCKSSEANIEEHTNTILRGLFKKANLEELHSLKETLGTSYSLLTHLLDQEIHNK